MNFKGLNGPAGEFASRALYRYTYVIPQDTGDTKLITGPGWSLSENYYFSLEDACVAHGPNVKWPVENFDNGLIYIPDSSEL